MNKNDKALLRAVLEPRKPGALSKIAEAVGAGANPNGICPEGHTSRGRVQAGSTLLTHSIHASESNAVKKLLECGADPNLADENGWTPWMASTLADESKRSRIQQALEEHGAEKSGAHIGELVRSVFDGNVEQATTLIETEQDIKVLATFRIDLVGHQISSDNLPMLELLLEHGMQPSSTNLTNAVRFEKLDAVDVLMRHGMTPEEEKDNETQLMVAASLGNLAMVQRLVEAGADVNRYADGNVEWTPSFYARQAGKAEVAEWLEKRMDTATRQQQADVVVSRNPKFQLLYDQATAGEELSTDELVAVLSSWDKVYGLAVLEAGPDRVRLRLDALPDDLESFIQEVFEICPDSSDYGESLPGELRKNRTLFLWWD